MRRRPSNAGFTLTELLLVTSLLVLFASTAVLSLAPLWRNAPLDEGVRRFEGLLRFARAEAAQQGRRVRLELSPSPTPLSSGPADRPLPRVLVQWEPEPLRQPGVFVPAPTTQGLSDSLSDLVRVQSIRHHPSELGDSISPDPLGPSSDPSSIAPTPSRDPRLATSSVGAAPSSEGLFPDATETTDPAWAPIMFYPDGTSDSAEIEIAAVDASESRRVVVRWNGLTGTAERGPACSDPNTDPTGTSADPASTNEPGSAAPMATEATAP